MTPIIIFRNGPAFGDRIMAGQMTAILRDHGVDAYWMEHDIRGLLDVPFKDDPPAIYWWFHYSPEKSFADGRGMMRRALDHFAADFKLPPMEITRRTPPVKIVHDPNIKGADVAICSKSGQCSPYRQYPQMPQLKEELTRRKISFVDMSEQNIKGHAALNWAAKSKLYLGIDTGMSHYVAGVVKCGLILQSGFTRKEFWASTYDRYEFLEEPMPCAPCFLCEGCPQQHRCMNIPVSKVADEIEKRL